MSLMTEAIIAQVGQLLEQHIDNSKAKLTPALINKRQKLLRKIYN